MQVQVIHGTEGQRPIQLQQAIVEARQRAKERREQEKEAKDHQPCQGTFTASGIVPHKEMPYVLVTTPQQDAMRRESRQVSDASVDFTFVPNRSANNIIVYRSTVVCLCPPHLVGDECRTGVDA